MSYQQAIRNLIADTAKGIKTELPCTVEIARPGTFEMKVIVDVRRARHEQVFDLKGGLTPGVRRSIEGWLRAIALDLNTADLNPAD